MANTYANEPRKYIFYVPPGAQSSNASLQAVPAPVPPTAPAVPTAPTVTAPAAPSQTQVEVQIPSTAPVRFSPREPVIPSIERSPRNPASAAAISGPNLFGNKDNTTTTTNINNNNDNVTETAQPNSKRGGRGKPLTESEVRFLFNCCLHHRSLFLDDRTTKVAFWQLISSCMESVVERPYSWQSCRRTVTERAVARRAQLEGPAVDQVAPTPSELDAKVDQWIAVQDQAEANKTAPKDAAPATRTGTGTTATNRTARHSTSRASRNSFLGILTASKRPRVSSSEEVGDGDEDNDDNDDDEHSGFSQKKKKQSATAILGSLLEVTKTMSRDMEEDRKQELLLTEREEQYDWLKKEIQELRRESQELKREMQQLRVSNISIHHKLDLLIKKKDQGADKVT